MFSSTLRNSHTARPGPLAGLTLWGAFQFSEVATRRPSNTGPVSACESHHRPTQETKRRAKRQEAGDDPQVAVNQDLGHSEEKGIHLQCHSLSVSRAVPREQTRGRTFHSILWDGLELTQYGPSPSAPHHPRVLGELHSFYILWRIYVQPTQQLEQ